MHGTITTICPACRGRGSWDDDDGNDHDCATCCGEMRVRDCDDCGKACHKSCDTCERCYELRSERSEHEDTDRAAYERAHAVGW